MEMKLAGEIKHSLVNGPGIRYVVFFQGCPHQCPGCQNPETHDFREGTIVNIEGLIARISGTKYLDGVTLSGGDPLMQPEACAEIAAAVRPMGLNVWLYTGWTMDDILVDPVKRAAVRDVNVIVDGRFIQTLRSETCLWRGSSNQRLIDVQKSLEKNETVEYMI
jgi:anaerobic ribonucleoside-triphosphate reductase activating protein